MRRTICLTLLAACLLVAACSDDDPPTTPEPEFSVTVRATLPGGGPAAGLRIAGMPVLSTWMPPDEPPAHGYDGPVVNPVVAFDMLAVGYAEGWVRDVDGDQVRTLFSQPLPEGLFQSEWDGRDDDGHPVPGGWYNVHIVLTWGEDAGQVIDLPVILEVCDPDWHSLGITDEAGVLEISDRRLVPALWDPEQAGDEVLTMDTILRLEDAAGNGQYVTFEATDGANEVTPVWDPTAAAFRLELVVSDAGGDPVAGVQVGAMPALPESVWLWTPNAAADRAAVAIPFTLTVERHVRLDIQDVAGDVTRRMDLGYCVAGVHRVMWNGHDDADAHACAGWYQAVLQISDDEGLTWSAVDATDMFMAAFDPDQVSLGETDADGRLVIDDRRLVPAFYGVPPCNFRDEEGNDLGTFSLTPTTWLYCQVPGGAATWVVVEAVDGPQTVPVTLDGATVVPLAGTSIPAGGPDRSLDGQAWLDGPYPNPFN